MLYVYYCWKDWIPVASNPVISVSPVLISLIQRWFLKAIT
jgi:hypothetical protein